MYCITRIALMCCFLTISLCRPPTVNELNENEETEIEYGDDESAVDVDDDSRLDGEDTMEEEQEDDSGSQMRNINDRPTKIDADSFSEYKFNKNSEDKYEESMNSKTNPNSDYQSHPQRRQSNTYYENNDANDHAETSQHFNSRDVNRVQNEIPQNEFSNKAKSFQSTSSNEEKSLFENKGNREQMCNSDKREFNNEAADSSELSRYFKKYFNTMKANKQARRDERTHENAHFYLNRDRRQTQDANKKDGECSHGGDIQNFGETVNEDEESAIKQHVKKLSGNELEELLNSLSDDKKELLSKIIENDHNNLENINKREVTKKAAALEENGCVEAGISDSRKIQGDAVIAHESDTTENILVKQTESQTEIIEISSANNADRFYTGGNKAEPTNISDVGNTEKTEVSLNNGNMANIGSNIQITSKNDNKREVNLNDEQNVEISSNDAKLLNSEISGRDSQKSLNDGYFCDQDEEFSQLMEDQAELYNNDGNLNKREAFLNNQIDVNNLKALEESFPNSNTCEETGQYAESDLVPLVRVKRKNEDLTVQERPAVLSPNAKVAYFPYRAENDDEDNEEGNEFDDEGFDDRTSNIAHINDANKPSDVMPGDNKHHLKSYSNTGFERNDNLGSDTMSIGSDTDSVLSGVEGVDDNLMFNSGSRSRRAIEDKPLDKNVKLNRPRRSTPLIDDEMKSASENHIIVPYYQENDAFGALPKNYETNLSRFKRIRGVKASPSDVSPLGA